MVSCWIFNVVQGVIKGDLKNHHCLCTKSNKLVVKVLSSAKFLKDSQTRKLAVERHKGMVSALENLFATISSNLSTEP